jgi:hypothetical protein
VQLFTKSYIPEFDRNTDQCGDEILEHRLSASETPAGLSVALIGDIELTE